MVFLDESVCGRPLANGRLLDTEVVVCRVAVGGLAEMDHEVNVGKDDLQDPLPSADHLYQQVELKKKLYFIFFLPLFCLSEKKSITPLCSDVLFLLVLISKSHIDCFVLS